MTNLSKLLTLSLCITSVFVPCLANEQGLSETRKQALTHLVKQDCGSCHGMTLKGGLGTPLQPNDLEGKPIAFLSASILLGRPGTAMPPWKAIITEQEATWIAKQLKKGTFL